MHIRRGDYLNPKHWNNCGCVCQKGYYDRAIKKAMETVINPKFFVFSDDIQWGNENIELPENTVYVDFNKGNDSWQDMFIMSRLR